MTRWSCLWVAALLLVGCSPEEKDPPPSREALLNSETCKDCHPKHHREWSASMHALASDDPVFVAMNRRLGAASDRAEGPG